jgi:hypothetical protein
MAPIAARNHAFGLRQDQDRLRRHFDLVGELGRIEIGRFSFKMPLAARRLFPIVIAVIGWRRHALKSAQQVLLGHAIELRVGVSISLSDKHAIDDSRRFFRLRLVNLDLFLQGMNEVFLQIARRQMGFGDLTQRDDGVLIVVAGNGERRAGSKPARSMAGHQDQIEAICDLINAIFNGNARHGGSPEDGQQRKEVNADLRRSARRLVAFD